MTPGHDAAVRQVARTLAAIADALGATDDIGGRIKRVLELTRDLVPGGRCALLLATADRAHEVIATPTPSEEEAASLLAMMTRMFSAIGEVDLRAERADAAPHLTLPVMALDTLIGLLRVEPRPRATFDEKDLYLLSVVAAQLGAYLVMHQLREDDARLVRELATAQDFHQRLVGAVSQDLLEPVKAITDTASLLLRTTEDPRHTRALERALRYAGRASRIITDLLDVTRVRVTGDLPVTLKRVDLRRLLEDVVLDMTTEHPTRQIVLNAAGNALEVDCDPDRFAQVVTKLIGNALQHGHLQSKVTVGLQAPPEAPTVSVSVHNDGPAIPAELLPLVFDPFKQGSSGMRRGGRGGLGLGLFIVDQAIRAQGGRVEVSSTSVSGTTFTVSLPRASRGAVDGVAVVRGAIVGAAAAEDVKAPVNATVMVVDDDADTRAGMVATLEGKGFAVLEAGSGIEALGLLRAGARPRLVLVDLHMPDMDGATFCAECSGDAELSGIPLVVISADAAAAVALAQHRSIGFLAKPLEVPQLIEAVRRAGTGN